MKIRDVFTPDLARLRTDQAGDDRRQNDSEQRRSKHRRPNWRVLPPPSAPMEVVRVFLVETTHENGALMLRYWRGSWWRWRQSHWKEAGPKLVRRLLYAFTEDACYATNDRLMPWSPNRRKIDDLLDALIALCLLPDDTDQPSWLDGRESGSIVACQNGLLDVERRLLLAHTPRFFNLTAVPFDFQPCARIPRTWRTFLKTLWPNDPQCRKALAQWFGYVVSGRLDLQKILLLVGPTRAGKGVIARVLSALIGPRNVAGPTLASLAADFGLAPLIGKPLAVISDARLSNRHGSVVVERLLSISGEDYLTVNIKYREQWTGQLPCRLFVISNELPEFGDASAAIVGRFIVLTLATSWLGKENLALEAELRKDLPGVLNWALAGLSHLERNGRFVEPQSSAEAITTIRDLASPVRAFVRDRCELDPDGRVAIDDLYVAYKEWADENGHPKLAKTTFGRNLRAAMPRLRVVQLGAYDSRTRVYTGLTLKVRREAD